MNQKSFRSVLDEMTEASKLATPSRAYDTRKDVTAMTLEQLSDKLILPVLAGKTPNEQRAILLALRKESGLRAQIWIDQQLEKLNSNQD